MDEPIGTNLKQEKAFGVDIYYGSKPDKTKVLCISRVLHRAGVSTIVHSKGCLNNTSSELPKVVYCFDDKGTFTKKLTGFKEKRRLDMMGRVIRVAIVPDLSTFQLEETEGDEIVAFAGVDYQIIKAISEKLNFTVKLLKVNDDDPKYANSTRTWPAAYDMLDRKEADIFISHININPGEMHAVDFTVPYIVESVLFCGKLPGFASKTYMLLRPFELKLWISLIIAYFLFGIVLQQVFSAEYRMCGGRKPLWTETYWNLSSTLLNQGNRDFERTSSRLIMILWIAMIFVLTVSYSGILTSFMSLPIRGHPIDTLPALEKAAREDTMRCIIYKGGMQYDLITRSNMPSRRGIRESLLKYSSRDIGYFSASIATGRYALLAESFLLDIFLAFNGKEKHYRSKDSLSNSLVSIAIRKGMSFKQDFDIIIRRMDEAGLIDKWVNDILSDTEKLYHQPTEETSQTDLGGTEVAFVLLIAGYIISSAVLILEIISSKLRCTI